MSIDMNDYDYVYNIQALFILFKSKINLFGWTSKLMIVFDFKV